MCSGIKWQFRLFLIGVIVRCVELISTQTTKNHNASSVEMLWELTHYALQESNGRQIQGRQRPGLGNHGSNGGYGLAYPNYNQQRPLVNNGYPYPTSTQNQPGQSGYPGYPQGPNSVASLMDVLHSIASNDELHCVPKLLCELTSGSGVNRQSSSLPFNVNMDSLLGLVSAFGPSSNPLFHFGKAALLGYTTQGTSCYRAFSRCPNDPDKLVNYLNNYNGGFFRYFQGVPGQKYEGQGQYPIHPNPQQSHAQYQGQHQNNQGAYQPNHDHYQNYYQTPQRPYRYQLNGAQQRILTQSLDKYYPYRYAHPYSDQDNHTGDRNRLTSGIRFPDDAYIGPNDIPVDDVFHAKRYKSPKTLTFPEETSASGGHSSRAPKTLTFPHRERGPREELDFQMVRPNHVASPYIFPTRTGTGELLLDTQEFY